MAGAVALNVFESRLDGGFERTTPVVDRFEPDAAPVEPRHMAGAYYPGEHPEFSTHSVQPSGSSWVPIASAALGGISVFALTGTIAFFALGMMAPKPDEIEIELDGLG